MATIIADYDLDAENASETIDAAEVDEVFGGHLPPDVKQVINSLWAAGICESYPSARTARTCPASMIGATTTTPGPWQRPSPTKTSSS